MSTTTIEHGLIELLRDTSSRLSESEIAEVQEFVDAGEYGLALETFCQIFIEEGKDCPAETLRRVETLADAMQMESGIWVELRDRCGRL